jgi:RND family efflux transporter MFP subunit
MRYAGQVGHIPPRGIVRVWRGSACFAAALLIGATGAMAQAPAPRTPQVQANVTAAAAASTQLATAVIDARASEAGIVADGVVEAVRQATIAAQIPGRILELRVEAGAVVAKGQVLARIDEREVAQVAAASEAQVARAQADLSAARVNLDRSKLLAEKKFVSPAAVDKAQADYDAAAAQVAAMKAGAGQSGAMKSYATITAPFSGVVSVRHAQLGDTVQPGMPLFTMYEPGRMRVVASVPETQLRDARAARTGSIELSAFDKPIGPVAMIVQPATDPRTHTGTVWLDLPASAGSVSPGSFARVSFAGSRGGATKRLMVPVQSVAYRSEVAGVYVVDEQGAIRFRQLRLGEAVGRDVEVLAGLQAGERIALDPVAALAQMKRAATAAAK